MKLQRQIWLRAGALLVLIFGLLSLNLLNHAEAHSSLVEQSPKKGEVTRKAPKTLKLQFNEPIEKNLANVIIYDRNGKPVFAGKPSAGNASRAPVLQFPLPVLSDGTYTVKWTIISLDGHPIDGSYSFSVGSKTESGTYAVSSAKNTPVWLIAARTIGQGLLMLVAGVYLFAFLARKRGLADLEKFNKKRYIILAVLLLASLGELAAYIYTLPSGIPGLLLSGGWQVIKEFPFILIICGQIAIVLLLLIPGLLGGFYTVLWLLLAATPAFGGHVWGTELPWLGLALRITHQLSITVWLGALAYIILLFWKKQDEHIDWKKFRSFFFKAAAIASALVVLSGIGMAWLQTGVDQIFRNWITWSTLLTFKVIGTAAMLLLALYQTLKWRKQGRFQTNRSIRLEWVAGIVIIFLGVWMSQIAYPVKIHEYDETLYSGKSKIQLHAADLRTGDPNMEIRVPELNGEDPEEVNIDLYMPAHGMYEGTIKAKLKRDGVYEASLPLSMAGKWQFFIEAKYPSDKKDWDTKFKVAGTPGS